MGIIKNGIMGDFSGKTGTVVGYRRNGKTAYAVCQEKEQAHLPQMNWQAERNSLTCRSGCNHLLTSYE